MDNMKGFGMMIQELKKNPKTIVFTEGTDERILEAASRLLAGSFLTPILVGNKEAVLEAAEKYGYNIRGGEIIDPDDYERFDEMVELFCELRKSKGVTPEQAAKTLKKNNYFGTMLVKMGRRTSWRSYLLYSRYRTSGTSADQDQTGIKLCIFLLHFGSSVSYR